MEESINIWKISASLDDGFGSITEFSNTINHFSEDDKDCDLDNVIDQFRKFLIMAGFSEKLVNEKLS